MNAYAIFAVNEHLEYLLDEAAHNRAVNAGEAQLLPADRQVGREPSTQRRQRDRSDAGPPEARRLPIPGLISSLSPAPPPSQRTNDLRPSGGGLRVSGTDHGRSDGVSMSRSDAPSGSSARHSRPGRSPRGARRAAPGAVADRRPAGTRPGSPPLTVEPPSGSAADRRRPRAPRRPRRRPSVPRPAARGHPARSPACRRPPRPRCRRGSPPDRRQRRRAGPRTACASCTT